VRLVSTAAGGAKYVLVVRQAVTVYATQLSGPTDDAELVAELCKVIQDMTLVVTGSFCRLPLNFDYQPRSELLQCTCCASQARKLSAFDIDLDEVYTVCRVAQ